MNAALEALLASAAVWRARGDAADAPKTATLQTGWTRLDAALSGGWPLGAPIELLLPETGVGELSLLLPALQTLARGDAANPLRWLLWVTPPHAPYPPALAQGGIPPGHVLLVQAPEGRDRLWTIEQALRSKSCAAVLAWLDAVDERWLRRISLAAAEGQALTVLYRSSRAQIEASPSVLRIVLHPTARGLDLEIIKQRGRGPTWVHDVFRT
jgi:hypothetical protein